MKKLAFLLPVLLAGCGTLFNGGSATIIPPTGGSVDGFAGPAAVSKKRSHVVTYPDGRTCVIPSNVSAGYVIADILIGPFLLNLLIDGVTGNWRVLDEDACPGTVVQ